MADNLIQGFQTDVGVRKYDYNALANKPTLITTSDLDKVIDTANDYTDEQIKKIDLSSINKIELDTSLSIQGKAADAKAVGEALESKLNKTELENLTNEIIDKIFGDTLFIMNCGKADI